MTNAEAWFNNSLRPLKPEGSLGRTAQDGHLDSHTAPELWFGNGHSLSLICQLPSEVIKHHFFSIIISFADLAIIVYHLAKMSSVTSVFSMKTAGSPRSNLRRAVISAKHFCFTVALRPQRPKRLLPYQMMME